MGAVVGKRLPRLEGALKATGQAQFTDDLFLPRMLYGKILRSPLPHARILNVDTRRALGLPGVKAVITGKDTSGRKYGVYARSADQSPLALDKVRYVGDEVAAVAAIDQETAEEALGLINVDYEELPAVFDAEEAIRPGAPAIHDVERNTGGTTTVNVGDVERGFGESDYIRQDRFSTGWQAHCQVEPHTVVAQSDASGNVMVWTPNMSPFTKRHVLAQLLELPDSKVRVCKAYVGGAFGGKAEVFSLDYCASLLALKTGRPVKITYTREEVFANTRLRHPMIIEIKTGVKRDGTLVARDCTVISDTGAYSSTGIMAVYLCCDSLIKTYRVPNVRYEGISVYTNKSVCGAMRGHGTIQMRFADESQLDMIAHDLGLDPVDIRLKNARQAGDILPNGSRVTSCALTDCIRQAAARSGWKDKFGKLPPNRGIGIACSTGRTFINVNPVSHSAALIKFNDDGKVTLLTGAVENGQGTETMLAQIAAEELGIPLEDVIVVAGDTELTPVDVGSFLMAETFITGNAVKLAAADAKHQLFEVTAPKLGATASGLAVENRRIFVKEQPERGMYYADAVRRSTVKGIPIIGKGYFSAKTEYLNVLTGEGKSSPTYSFCAQVSEIEVDPKTGQVKVLRSVLADDCGVAINPMDVEGQAEGCLATAQGMALSEEVMWENGRMLNPSFLDYGIPRASEMPRMETIIVESHDPDGPFGAKDAGEPPAHVGPACIANAFYNATGVRITETPMTPEKVVKALDAKGKGKRRKGKEEREEEKGDE
ncbi:MAG: molybdopterin-dependent oxidoreductase [Chloroflexi bacterium]|nr:molybdopterin-dependent oxidoreductase [Chloroflexota bacterium]